MISHVRIQNLRSLVDTGFVEIKPLTILLGSNSSGKSTFLRSFPLFTQSVNKPLREPISWFDDAYVDFGDYDTAKSKLAPEEEGIKFSYRLQSPYCLIGAFRQHSSFRSNQNLPKSILEIINNCEFELSFQKDSKGGIYVNGVEIKTGDLKISFSTRERNGWVYIMVNDSPLDSEIKYRWNYGPRNVLVPEFETRRTNDSQVIHIEDDLEILAMEAIRKHCRRTLTNLDRIRSLINNWTIDKTAYLNSLKNASSLSTLRKHAVLWTETSEDFLAIYNLIAASRSIYCFAVLDMELREQYQNCSYVTPLRAAANRYYRSQGLQVRDVDPYGRNLPEFISSLSQYRKTDYEDFTEKVLGLRVTVENRNGHQSIILKNSKAKSERNMTDVGFGYSQILPIITKLWNTKFNGQDGPKGYYYQNFERELIAIEQPELHLHPAMQARTADIMMLTLNELKDLENLRRDRYIKRRTEEDDIFYPSSYTLAPLMLVETHSQAMINRVGKRIREKRFSADDVSILLFEKDENTGVTNITPITYNEKGQLTNWPYGFFEPTDNDYDFLFDRQLKG